MRHVICTFWYRTERIACHGPHGNLSRTGPLRSGDDDRLASGLLRSDDLQDVPVRVLEPGHLELAGDVNVSLQRQARQVVVLERHAVRLERGHERVEIGS